MSNINLNLATKDVSQDRATLGSGIVVSFIVLILVLLLYGALLYFNRNLSFQIKNTQDQYQSEYNKFLVGNGSEVLDFENRSIVAKELMAEDQSIIEILNKIEEFILPSVYLSSFNYSKGKKLISLDCVGDNLNTVAKQILSFKQSGYFSEVTPGPSLINSQTSEMNFKIDLKIK